MATFRILAVAMAIVGSAALAPAHACDSLYPWLCQPVPSIDPPEAPEPSKPAAKPQAAPKPLPIATQRGRDVRASARNTRAAQAQVHKRSVRKPAARHWALRARHAKIVAARAAPEAAKAAAIEATHGDSAKASNVESPALAPAPTADNGAGPSSGFASMWAERSAAEPAIDAAVARAPTVDVTSTASGEATEAVPAAPAPSVAIVGQDEPNELDLAAPEPVVSNSSWLRGLFLAFGGLIAVGSALRLFL